MAPNPTFLDRSVGSNASGMKVYLGRSCMRRLGSLKVHQHWKSSVLSWNFPHLASNFVCREPMRINPVVVIDMLTSGDVTLDSKRKWCFEESHDDPSKRFSSVMQKYETTSILLYVKEKGQHWCFLSSSSREISLAKCLPFNFRLPFLWRTANQWLENGGTADCPSLFLSQQHTVRPRPLCWSTGTILRDSTSLPP